MGENIGEGCFFNEFSVQMLSKNDSGLQYVKKLEKAVFELKNLNLRGNLD
jgi:hypothetical protein